MVCRRNAPAMKSATNLRRNMRRNFSFGANEVPDLPETIQEIEKYLKLGAVIIAESKFGVECDSPEMQKIYALAQEYNVPILMHWQVKMYNYGFERFHKMLEKFPKVNFIGHAQTWWANIDKDQQGPRVASVSENKSDARRIDRPLPERLSKYVRRYFGWFRIEFPRARRRSHARISRTASGQTSLRQRLRGYDRTRPVVRARKPSRRFDGFRLQNRSNAKFFSRIRRRCFGYRILVIEP